MTCDLILSVPLTCTGVAGQIIRGPIALVSTSGKWNLFLGASIGTYFTTIFLSF